MSTPRDVLIIALDRGSGRSAEPGDLSLALAGAELLDLLASLAAGLDGDRIVPADQPPAGDRLLEEAAASLVRTPPYESVADWLWRRGRGLFAAYRDALEAEGLLVRQGRRGPFRTGRLGVADSAARRRAEDRWAADEPVLTALAQALGVPGKPAGESPDVADDAVATVLAAVNDALMELEGVRQRRAVEQAAFDNVWRGGAGG